MTRVVVDASVVVKGFAGVDERHAAQAHQLFERLEAGAVELVAPELVLLEVLDVAGRKWRLAASALDVLAVSLEDLRIDLRQVDPRRVAAWVGEGLTAYDAAYVAVAEECGLPLLTDDDSIVAMAPSIAQALAAYD